MSQDGVTISSDLFQLTTNSAESNLLGSVVSELADHTRDNYGQYCGLARAGEMIGERWSLLILRDLLVSPKSAAELRAGLQRITPDVLAKRLRELETSGVIRRQDPLREQAVYELTEYGRAVDQALLTLSRWGAMALATPRPEDIVTEDSMVMALRTMFHAEAAAGVKVGFELQVDGVVVHAVVDNGTLAANPGPLPGADLVIESGMALRDVLGGSVSVAEAIATGQVTVTGDSALLATFVKLFQLPPAPGPTQR